MNPLAGCEVMITSDTTHLKLCLDPVVGQFGSKVVQLEGLLLIRPVMFQQTLHLQEAADLRLCFPQRLRQEAPASPQCLLFLFGFIAVERKRRQGKLLFGYTFMLLTSLNCPH